MIRDVGNAALLAFRRLRSQIGLLALLLAASLLLSVGAAPLWGALFGEGQSFTGMTLAVCGAEEEDELTRKLVSAATLAAGVEDYCTIQFVTEEDGRASLKQGEITALLILPEGFVESVLSGENKAVTVLTNGNQPLESYLIVQLGESVSRMLAAAQAGIYTVMNEAGQMELTDDEREELLWEINLAYIGWVSARDEQYDTITVSPSGGSLPVAEHYILSILAYLPLLCPALVYPAFGGKELLKWHRRQRALGISAKAGAMGGILASSLMLLPLILLPLLLLGGELLPSLAGAFLTALFCAAFCGLCCAVTDSPGGAALLAFLLGTGMMFLSGGVLPPVLLPKGLRALTDWMPLSWARTLLSGALGWDVTGKAGVGLVLVMAVLIIVTLCQFNRRVSGEEGGI